MLADGLSLWPMTLVAITFFLPLSWCYNFSLRK